MVEFNWQNSVPALTGIACGKASTKALMF